MSNSERSERPSERPPKRQATEVAYERIQEIHIYHRSSNNPLSQPQPFIPPKDKDYVFAVTKQTNSSKSNGGKHPKGSPYHYDRNS